MRARIVRGAGIAAAGFVLSRAITFGAYIAIAALISPKTAGIFAAGSLVASVGVLFASSGMLAAVIQWRGDVEEAASTAFMATLVGGILLAGLAAATAPLVGLFFQSDAIEEIALACSGLLFLRALMVVPDALLQRRFSFVRRVVVDPLGAATFAVVAIVTCANGAGAWGLVAGTYALYGVQVLAAWTFVRWRPRRSQMSFAVWRQLILFGRHVVASEIVRQTVSHMDALLLGRFAGAAALGQYNYGLRLAGQPVGGFISVAAYVLFPAFARVAEEDPARMRRSFVESLATASVFLLPISFVLIPAGDHLALLAFGPEWGGAGEVIKALSFVGVGWMWVSLASEGAKAVGRPQLITRLHLVSLAASVVLMPSLLWADEVGIAIAVSGAAMISGTYGLWQVGGAMGLSLKEQLVPVLGTATAAALGAAAAGVLDLALFADVTTRGEAAVAAGAESLACLVAFVAGLRLLAPADAGRITDLVGQLRGRGKAASA